MAGENAWCWAGVVSSADTLPSYRNFAGLGPYMTASHNSGRIALSVFERMAALSAEGDHSADEGDADEERNSDL